MMIVERLRSATNPIAAAAPLIGWWGLAAALTGCALSIGGAIWAIRTDVPVPIAVMAGFCVFACGIGLGLVPMAFRCFSQVTAASQPHEIAKPNYAVWRRMAKYSISDLAYLFCDGEPRQVPPPPGRDSWERVLIDAIQSDQLEMLYKKRDSSFLARENSRQLANSSTEVSRKALKRFAKKRGYTPPFLNDS